MKIYILTLFTILVLSFVSFGQDIEATTKDGKKVILKLNKTWEFVKDTALPNPKKTETPGSSVIADNLQEITDFLDSYKQEMGKTEFETEKEYIQRIKNFSKNTKNPKTNRSLAETTFILSSIPRYDAETQTFLTDLFQVGVETSTNETAKYIEYFLRIGQRGLFGWKDLSYSTNLPKYKTSPKNAKEIKAQLKLAVIGFPVEISSYKNASLVFLPTKYVLFNKETGEIYAQSVEADLTIDLVERLTK